MNDFWSKDRTTIHEKNTWYGLLQPKQKFCYTLLLTFIICWCFYLGMNLGFASYPPIEMLTEADPYNPENDPALAVTEPPPMLEGQDVVLLVGADKREGENVYRTDTIMIAFIDWENNNINLLSVPRDSYVQLPGYSTKTKINEAYFYGGISLLKSTIEYTLGIAVEKYVEIDFNGFIELIDAIGGVEIDVPVNMYKSSENIAIDAGLQTLDGVDALGFVRFRDLPMGDIDRIANQQMFIQELAQKFTDPTIILKVPQLANIAWEYVNTDYTLSEILEVSNSLLQMDLNTINTYSLPGAGMWIGQGNYWMLNRTQTIEMITEFAAGEAIGETNIIYNDSATYNPPADEPEEDILLDENGLPIVPEGTDIDGDGIIDTPPVDTNGDGVIDALDAVGDTPPPSEVIVVNPTDPNADPNAVDPNADPNAVDPNADPNAVDPNADPNAVDPNADPNAIDPNLNPNQNPDDVPQLEENEQPPAEETEQPPAEEATEPTEQPTETEQPPADDTDTN